MLDNELLDAKTAIEALMDRYGKDVWNLAFVLSRSAHLADDITQDVFIKAYQNFASFRGDSSYRTWLLAITRNVTRDYQRSGFLRRVTLMEYILPKEVYPSAEKEAFQKLVTDDIWRSVLQLSAKLREVLVLHVHHQLTISEIAALLKVPEVTVRTRLHRARTKASILLEEGGFHDKIHMGKEFDQ